MLPDPLDVDRERLAEALHPGVELRLIIEENEVQPRELPGDFGVIDAAEDNGGETLVERRGERYLFGTDVGAHRIRAQHEDDGVRLSNEALDAFPPILEGVDIGAVNERLEPARPQRRVESVRKGH